MVGSSRFVQLLEVEPEYCPQAVVQWFLLGLDKRKKKKKSGGGDDDDNEEYSSETRLKARKHLAAMKWLFWYGQKGDRKELRYTSPAGKVYYSLRTACKGCIDDGGVPQSLVSSSRDCNNDHKTKFEEGFVRSKAKRAFEQTSDRVMQSGKKRKVDGGLNKVEVFSTHIRVNLRTTTNAIEKPRVGKVFTTMMKLRDGEQEPTQSRNSNRSLVLSRLIENEAVVPGAKVYYRGKGGAALAEGWITSDGIKCCCCDKVYTLSEFEFHAGSKKHRPAANLFLEDGRSLLECQTQISLNSKMVTRGKSLRQMKGSKGCKVDYDVCCVCHDGGTLIICDLCGCTYHHLCLGLKVVPEGDWFCPPCCCGICGKAKFAQTTETQPSVDDAVVRTCDQCEHKFHVACVRSKSEVELQNHCFQNKWFCSGRCEHIFSGLQELVGRPILLDKDEEITWRLLKPVVSLSESVCEDNDSEALIENQRRLNVALDVMHECFEPAKDSVTGRDLVEDVIFNRRSEVKYKNFQGFYTVVLEKEGKVVTAATLRVFEKVAELPFVATRFKYRRHGMCRLLMDELQKQLIALGVVTLILHAAPTVLNTWIKKFGFSEIASERFKYLNYTFLDFQDTIMCQKVLTTIPSATCSSPVSVLQGEKIEAT